MHPRPHPSRIAIAPLAIVLATTILGCTAAGESGGDASSGAATWMVEAVPLQRLAPNGDAPYDFLRITRVMRLPTGELVVADGASRELRLFGEDGAYRRALSREGGGPGELRELSWAGRAADTVFAFGWGARFVNAYTREGLVSEVPLQSSGSGGTQPASAAGGAPLPPSGPSVQGRLTSGALLVLPVSLRILPDLEPGVLHRGEEELALLMPGADSGLVPLGTHPATTLYTYRVTGLPMRALAGRFTYGPQLVYGASGDRVWIGDSGRDTIAIHDATGARVGSAVWPEAPRPLDAAAIARVRERELAAAPDERRRSAIETLHGEALRPVTAPRFTAFVPGPDGEMWVERYREDPLEAAEFLVFDADGRFVARVELPPRFTPHEIGADYVVGVEKDENDVEIPVEYRLRRGTAP